MVYTSRSMIRFSFFCVLLLLCSCLEGYTKKTYTCRALYAVQTRDGITEPASYSFDTTNNHLQFSQSLSGDVDLSGYYTFNANGELFQWVWEERTYAMTERRIYTFHLGRVSEILTINKENGDTLGLTAFNNKGLPVKAITKGIQSDSIVESSMSYRYNDNGIMSEVVITGTVFDTTLVYNPKEVTKQDGIFLPPNSYKLDCRMYWGGDYMVDACDIITFNYNDELQESFQLSNWPNGETLHQAYSTHGIMGCVEYLDSNGVVNTQGSFPMYTFYHFADIHIDSESGELTITPSEKFEPFDN